MSSPSQNNYDTRLAEKLALIASKRGVTSPPAAELKHVTGAPAEASKDVTEKQKPQEKK